ncbi:MAG: hypothetical protein P1U82_28495 [Verrucomicrobiales bacterium]|nr:hypothetical protein [Verrucomicrobiales bacterium]
MKTFRWRRAVGGVEDCRLWRFRGDLDFEWLVEEAAIDGELGVRDKATNRRTIGQRRSRHSKVGRLQRIFPEPIGDARTLLGNVSQLIDHLKHRLA